jgi:hypothetical protein
VTLEEAMARAIEIVLPLEGWRWCEECRCSTNHTTTQHRAAEREDDDLTC